MRPKAGRIFSNFIQPDSSFTRTTDRQGSNFEREETETTEGENRHSVLSVSSCSSGQSIVNSFFT
jgi:hypothetical protein